MLPNDSHEASRARLPATSPKPAKPPAAAASAPAAPRAPGAGSPPVWQRAVTLAVATAVMVAAGYGVGSFLRDAPWSAPQQAQASEEPFTLYITDLPAALSALDVKVGGVFVGPDQKPMTILNPAFDLAALHGPDGAIPLATLNIPEEQREPVIIIFESAEATINGTKRAIPSLAPLVLTGSSAFATGDPGLLLDVDLAASVTEENGTLAFQPTLQAIYSSSSLNSDGATAWDYLELPPQLTATVLAPAGLAGEAAMRAAQALDRAGLGTPAIATEAINATQENPLTGMGWLVQFVDANVSRDQMLTVVDASGALFVQALVSLPVAHVIATDGQAQLLEQNPLVERIEREVPITFDDVHSQQAMRLAQVNNALTGLKDPQGRPITGVGIGVAVVDSGIDATHTDLPYRPLVPGGVVAGNYKVISQTATSLPNTDTTSGHGTHVASIVAGQGTADPLQVGVAPGASLYGLGIGESSTTAWGAQAFDWIIANGPTANPPIKVVTNSWSAGTVYDPNSVTTRLVNRMVEQGMVVVFSASNNGGDGSQIKTSAQCQIPTPGVVCVAAFDDLGTGTRDGAIAPYSSRGAISTPASWPDVSAPGNAIRGARPLVGAQTGVATSSYVEMSGTSQAAPHVAGLVALMRQADPGLSPAQVEQLLERTAYKYTDGGAYGPSSSPLPLQSHHAKGHGLVDAYAAVVAALA